MAIGARTARIAGKMPPQIPIARAYVTPPTSKRGGTVSWSHLAERLEVHGRRLVAVGHQVGDAAPDEPAEEGEEQRPGHHRDEHRTRLETQRAQRRDLPATRRDRRVH